jgi:hypothetical protein
VTVAGGSTSATFTVTSKTVTADTLVTLTATYSGKTLGTQLKVTAAAPVAATLANLTVFPNSIVGGTHAYGTVVLSGAAPAGGASVTLASSSAMATVQGTVTIQAGWTFGWFPIDTKSVTAATPVTLTATLAGVSKTAALTLTPVALQSVTVGGTSSRSSTAHGTVRLNGPAAGSAVVTLTSSNPSAASVPASITIPAGESSASFTVTLNAVKSSTAVTITAQYAGVTKSDSVVARSR